LKIQFCTEKTEEHTYAKQCMHFIYNIYRSCTNNCTPGCTLLDDVENRFMSCVDLNRCGF
ncbi:hypothetical protein T4B_2761, partial [Trichinella pseudospiralis]